MEPVLEAIENRKERAVSVLTDLLRIPSISALPAHRDDVRRAAEHLAELFRQEGLPTVEVVATDGHPIVFAEWVEAPGAPTVLVYGHYDVQPIVDESLWTTPPFEPTVRDGKVFARGATDDKGQMLTHVLAAGAHLSVNGSLPVNVKFVIEGEEEVGSASLEPYLREQASRLACDAVVISDTAMYEAGVPSLCVGLRGMAYVELALRGAETDLHSGQFGGVIDNPAIALARLVAGMKDERTGRILIEGFYEGVTEPSDEEKAGWAALPPSDDRIREMTGVPRLHGEEGRTVLERAWSRPTLDVNGMWSGFTGEGSMTVLPSRASAKISMRLVGDQDPDDITTKFRRHVDANLSDTVVVDDFRVLHVARPWVTSMDHPAVRAAFRAVEKGFGTAPVPTREGGSIPIVPLFTEVLGAPAVLMGFGLPDERPHGPDERFDLGNFQSGIRTAACFLEEFSAVSARKESA